MLLVEIGAGFCRMKKSVSFEFDTYNIKMTNKHTILCEERICFGSNYDRIEYASAYEGLSNSTDA